MSRTRWLEVDLVGLEQILSRRSKEFIVLELVQNAWDEHCTVVEISLPQPKRGKTTLVVTDDSPDGFKNLKHAYTLFANSQKKRNAAQRGMFNSGEKFVLAFCEEAAIISTAGGVVFDHLGRRTTRRRRERGTEFAATVRLSDEDWIGICNVMRSLIPPVKTVFNGKEVPNRTPIHVFSSTLPTLIGDELGNLTRKLRKTEVAIFEPQPGEIATLYEMGLPVVATGDKWHVNIHQKAPLTLERNNGPPSYLQMVRVAVLNEMSRILNAEDASSTWVRQAAGDPRVIAPAFNNIMDLRFSEKRVTRDPSDPEANLIAAAKGYVVVGASSLSPEEWSNVRRFGSSLPAGRVTPSPKPFSPDGKPLRLLDPQQKTAAHRQFEVFARTLAAELIDCNLTVVFADDANWQFGGCYGNAVLTVNVAAKGCEWFKGSPAVLLEHWIPFLLHEFAHDRVRGHLTEEYHRECCRLAGALAKAMYTAPTLFRLIEQ